MNRNFKPEKKKRYFTYFQNVNGMDCCGYIELSNLTRISVCDLVIPLHIFHLSTFQVENID